MSRTLDRSKPFGEVYGASQGHRFEQDGRLFDHDGKEIAAKAAAGAQTAADDLDAMEAEELHVLAGLEGVKLHPQTGAAKARVAIREHRAAVAAGAQTAAAAGDDQVAQQIEG